MTTTHHALPTQNSATWLSLLCPMLSIFRITLVLLFFMALIKYPGCNHQFESTAGLAMYKHTCKAKITATATRLLQTCKVNLEQRADAK
jgi:hypothetical protein